MIAERRRHPRTVLQRPRRLAVTVTLPVQVADISASGALLIGQGELPAGSRAQLKAALGSPFVADVRITRATAVANRSPGAVGLAASFSQVEPVYQQVLTDFLIHAGHGDQ